MARLAREVRFGPAERGARNQNHVMAHQQRQVRSLRRLTAGCVLTILAGGCSRRSRCRRCSAGSHRRDPQPPGRELCRRALRCPTRRQLGEPGAHPCVGSRRGGAEARPRDRRRLHRSSAAFAGDRGSLRRGRAGRKALEAASGTSQDVAVHARAGARPARREEGRARGSGSFPTASETARPARRGGAPARPRAGSTATRALAFGFRAEPTRRRRLPLVRTSASRRGSCRAELLTRRGPVRPIGAVDVNGRHAPAVRDLTAVV